MILIGIGSNLAAPGYRTPQDTAAAGARHLPMMGVAIVRLSQWFRSEPVPPSDQPWYVNGVAAVATELDPTALLAVMMAIEARFGRRRGEPNAARTLDLDLLDYAGRECATPGLTLPHPRLHERRFVLAPLVEIAPHWRHPRLRLTAVELLGHLPSGQPVHPIGEETMPQG